MGHRAELYAVRCRVRCGHGHLIVARGIRARVCRASRVGSVRQLAYPGTNRWFRPGGMYEYGVMPSCCGTAGDGSPLLLLLLLANPRTPATDIC